MPKISEKDWKSALTFILQELKEDQYNILLEYLSKIPQSRRKSREEMPQIIIEHYGVKESISEIKEAMERIPRRDSAVQDLLRPFVGKLKNKREKDKTGKKRKYAGDPEHEEQKSSADQLKNSQPDTERNNQTWRKTIRDLKASGQLLDTEAIVGKVMQKSGLHTYKKQDDKENAFFYVSVADDTGFIEVTVYGKHRYQEINEERSYLFRKLIIDKNGVKVIKKSKVPETHAVEVPAELEKEARKLICIQSPVCSVAKAKTYPEKYGVSVEGTVTEIYPVKETEVTSQQRTTKTQEFHLEDDTDSISICMWGGNTEQSKEISVGDVIKVTNVKTSHYHDTVSLNSTGFTRIFTIERAPVQTVRIQIQAIESTDTQTQTFLDAVINGQIKTFVVASQLLASEFDSIDFRKSLLDKMPFLADVEIQGSKINKMKYITKI
ncbi:uncharacterized protein LOC121909803 [Thunnus maccoyii]|uniref:uncharacterized protein LOC121909803 n=1 Tax=Thunnus maccoyii TaxID=8240 RepID=UPI001C4AE5D7|nr:uncharacterized protein LOC121909803 [Thunnus maccoyii]